MVEFSIESNHMKFKEKIEFKILRILFLLITLVKNQVAKFNKKKLPSAVYDISWQVNIMHSKEGLALL